MIEALKFYREKAFDIVELLHYTQICRVEILASERLICTIEISLNKMRAKLIAEMRKPNRLS